MPFPLGFWDLSLWLAITATILLVTSELLSAYYGKLNILVNRKRLQNVALTISILSLIVGAMIILSMVFEP